MKTKDVDNVVYWVAVWMGYFLDFHHREVGPGI